MQGARWWLAGGAPHTVLLAVPTLPQPHCPDARQQRPTRRPAPLLPHLGLVQLDVHVLQVVREVVLVVVTLLCGAGISGRAGRALAWQTFGRPCNTCSRPSATRPAGPKRPGSPASAALPSRRPLMNSVHDGGSAASAAFCAHGMAAWHGRQQWAGARLRQAAASHGGRWLGCNLSVLPQCCWMPATTARTCWW